LKAGWPGLAHVFFKRPDDLEHRSPKELVKELIEAERELLKLQAREQLDRVFQLGGVSALVGGTYGAAKDVGGYQTGEAIRGLVDLESKERDR
jgi:hypothetical protein